MLSIKKITLRPKGGSSSKPNAADFYHRSRIYVGPDKETVMENYMGGRYTRPHTLYRKEILPQLWRILGLGNGSFEDKIQAGWSQKAGCSCGCSPGFIIKQGNVPFDIWVDVTDKNVLEVEISGTIRG